MNRDHKLTLIMDRPVKISKRGERLRAVYLESASPRDRDAEGRPQLLPAAGDFETKTVTGAVAKALLVLSRSAGIALEQRPNSPLEAKISAVLGGPIDFASWFAVRAAGRGELVLDLAPPRDPDDVLEVKRRQYASGTTVPLQLAVDRGFALNDSRRCRRTRVKAVRADVAVPEHLVALRPGSEPGLLEFDFARESIPESFAVT